MLHPVQQAFRECHALQCGFCTPGFLTTIAAGLEARDNSAEITDEEVDEIVGGNLCRCTGYANIKKAVRHAATAMRDARDTCGIAADSDYRRSRRGTAVTTKLFGEPVRRREDARLIIGKGRYLDDIGSGALAAAFVRSPHAHARIVDIDADAALEVEGLVAIYTYEDLTGPMAEPLPVLIPHPQLTAPRTGYPLANGEVNHVGEPIVMVVATDRYVAEDACDRIVVTYEELPVVVGVDAARAAEHAVHDEIPDNVAAVHHQETGDVEAALAASPRTISFTQYIERSASMPMEGKGVHARWDADDRSLRVYSSTQASTSVRAAIAAKLELSVDKVEVIAPDVGGGFGMKIVHPWPEELLVPMAAIALGQEVKWAEDRREHFISSAHERQQRQEITAGYDDDGRVTALDVHIWHDNGAYTPYGIIIPIVTATQLVGPYAIPTYRVKVESVYTNTVIVTPYRGAGRPQGCYAMERTMDRIADELGLDRAVVRERNLITPDQFPYDHHLTFQDGRPVIYDSGDYPGLLDKLRALVGWSEADRCAPTPRRAASCSASGWRCTSRAPGRARTRAATCRCSAAARCSSRPG